ncbi:MAG: S8 family serine peptidase, partial [Bacteroidota bacterium]
DGTAPSVSTVNSPLAGGAPDVFATNTPAVFRDGSGPTGAVPVTGELVVDVVGGTQPHVAIATAPSMKKIYLMVCLALAFVVKGQDWTSDASNLYYISSQGKVFIEADHSAMAIYFKEGVKNEISTKFRNSIQGRSQQFDVSNIHVMDLKGMIQIKSTDGLSPIRTANERADFLRTYDLAPDGAYDVLPAFRVDGMQAWLTKRVVIRLKDGVDLAQVQDLVTKNDGVFVDNLTDDNTFIFQVNQIENQFHLIHEINDRGLLDWGEPDFKMELVRRIDPFYQYQWHLNNTGGTDLGGKALLNDADIDAPEAWGVALGNNVTVAVIDDGLENHEDMATLLPGYTPANGGNGTPSLSTDGHGQQCAGLIGALHNEIGVRGVSPGVDMFSVNIFAPNTSNADVAAGINWAVNNGADVLSNSWGFTSCTANISSVTSAFNNAATNGRGGLGCIILVASGNDFNTCVSYPADLPSVTAVGGISGDGERSNFSNYGPTLDLVAPSNDDWVFNAQGQLISNAHNLVTIDREGSAGWFSGNYSDGFGGTSGATPIAAGVAALVLSVNPSLTKAQVENILYTTADDIGPSGFDNEYGNGRVNAYQAVLAAGGSTDNTSPSVPTGLSSSNVQATTFDVSWNASTDNVGVTGYNVYLNGSSIGSVSGTSASLTGLSPSTSYNVAVSAVDAAGNESGQSSSINVTTGAASLSCSSSVSSYPYSEGFESGDGWTQAGGDDGNWYRNSGSTPSNNTGPGSAAQGSFYLFLEASTNNSPGQIGNNATAILESDCFDLSGASTATFSFQNHMFGSNVGSLNLEVSVDDLTWTSLWSQSGSQGNQWNSVDVNLNSYAGGVIRLRLVGTTGNGWSSDIALDDLSLTTNGGGGDTQAPSTPTGLSASSITTSSFDVSWNASSDNVGVTGYNVYLGGSLDGTSTSTSYSFSGLTASTTYAVAVEAFDAAGNTSGQASTNITTDTPSGGCSNVTVDSNDFESGWGIWNDGGSDARRSANDAAYSNGTYSIRLRDNTSTSTMTTDLLDLSSFEDITVSFSYLARSMDNANEDFWLQVSTNGGSSYTIVEEWNQGDEFVNNVRENDAVTITGPFTSNTRLRFRCDASGNSDWVYIDDVVITGCSASGASVNITKTNTQPISDEFEIDLDDIELYPNPVQDVLRINGMPQDAKVRLISLNGTIISSGVGQSEFEMQGLNSGIYLLQVELDGESQTFKVIKR